MIDTQKLELKKLNGIQKMLLAHSRIEEKHSQVDVKSAFEKLREGCEDSFMEKSLFQNSMLSEIKPEMPFTNKNLRGFSLKQDFIEATDEKFEAEKAAMERSAAKANSRRDEFSRDSCEKV
jgi:hypothetical protein